MTTITKSWMNERAISGPYGVWTQMDGCGVVYDGRLGYWDLGARFSSDMYGGDLIVVRAWPLA